MKTSGFSLVFISIISVAILIIKSILFDINCGDYLKRAADSNTTELAIENLNHALTYMEEHGMTHGYTSVIYNSPNEDVGFWYKNIKNAYEELIALDSNASNIEKSNLLMKLRETLLDQTTKGECLTLPCAISYFPNNTFWAILKWISGILFLVGFLLIAASRY